MPQLRMLLALGLPLALQQLSAVEAVPVTAGKPVQVYIMMGQSNMLGEGAKFGDKKGSLQNAVTTEHKYPYLWDKSIGNWSTSKTVRARD